MTSKPTTRADTQKLAAQEGADAPLAHSTAIDHTTDSESKQAEIENVQKSTPELDQISNQDPITSNNNNNNSNNTSPDLMQFLKKLDQKFDIQSKKFDKQSDELNALNKETKQQSQEISKAIEILNQNLSSQSVRISQLENSQSQQEKNLQQKIENIAHNLNKEINIREEQNNHKIESLNQRYDAINQTIKKDKTEITDKIGLLTKYNQSHGTAIAKLDISTRQINSSLETLQQQTQTEFLNINESIANGTINPTLENTVKQIIENKVKENLTYSQFNYSGNNNQKPKYSFLEVQQLIQNQPKFSRELQLSGPHPKDVVKKFQKLITDHEITPTMARDIFPFFLEGEAKQWALESYYQDIEIEEILNRFLEKYWSASTQATFLSQQLYSPISYRQPMSKIFSQRYRWAQHLETPLPEPNLIEILIALLPYNIQNNLISIPRQYKTIISVLEKLDKIQNSQHNSNQASQIRPQPSNLNRSPQHNYNAPHNNTNSNVSRSYNNNQNNPSTTPAARPIPPKPPTPIPPRRNPPRPGRNEQPGRAQLAACTVCPPVRYRNESPDQIDNELPENDNPLFPEGQGTQGSY